MATPIYPLTIQEELENVRHDSLNDLTRKFATMQCTTRNAAPHLYINTLPESEQTIAIRICLLIYYVTKGQEVPKLLQVQAAIASVEQNTLVVAGTGFGKTQIMAALMLLERSSSCRIFITISPLNRLQVTQVDTFSNKYGIRTLAINKDTPRTKEYWRDEIHNHLKNATQNQTARHLIITAEQFFKTTEGHFSKLALLLRDHLFCQRIAHVNIDEAHFVHFAGTSRFDLAPFRPAWGRLSELRLRLPKTVCYHAFTATSPPHVRKTIEESLLGTNYSFFQSCINRPGIIYARHCVVGSFETLENYLCFIRTPFPANGSLIDQPRVLLFFDNNNLALRVSKFLDSHAPPQFRRKNFVMHYYSIMSNEYLKIAHKAFTDPAGPCRILCATTAESTGIDFPDVRITVNVGVVDPTEDEQRRGRGNRDWLGGLHVILYEPWICDVSLSDFDELPSFSSDPDRPRALMKKGSTKRDRLPRSGLESILTACIREYRANYFANDSLTRLSFDSYCCDGNAHTDGFRLQDHLPGPIWMTTLEQDSKRKAVTEAAENVDDKENEDSDEEFVDHSKRRRKPAHCKPLVERLLRWRSAEHEKDLLKDFWPEYFIVTDQEILRICQIHPINLTSTGVIISTIDKPLDGDFAQLWAPMILDVIQVFDNQYKVRVNKTRKATKRQRTIQ